MSLRVSLFLPVLLVLPAIAAAQAIGEAAEARDPSILTVTDLARVARITDVEVSPDGSRAVYLVRTIHGDTADREEETGYHTNMMLVDLTREDATPLALTHGSQGASSPAISPGGSTLAFVRAGEEGRGGEGQAQLWLLPLDGPGEARQVTELEEGAASPRWLGDGQRILVTTSVELSDLKVAPPWSDLRPGRNWVASAEEEGEDDKEPEADPDGDLDSLRRWLDAGTGEEDPSAIARLAFQGERGLRGAESVARLVVIDVSGTAEPVELDTGFFDVGGAVPSPDGTWAVFSDRADSEQHPDESRRSALWHVNLATGAVELLRSENASSLGSPRYAPDGESLWFTSRSIDEPSFANTLLRLTKSGEPRGSSHTIAAGVDANVGNLRVDQDGSVWFTFSKDGRIGLYHVNQEGRGDVVAVVPGEERGALSPLGGEILAVDMKAGRVVMALSCADDPSYLVTRTQGEASRVIARPNAELLASLTLSVPRMHRLERPDGFTVQYWVLPGRLSEDGSPSPVVLSLHGGPHVMWGAGSHSMWHEWQWMAARGYTVVFANPRGSDGYGYDHRKGNYRDWGTGPGGDVLACLDDALERYADEVDAKRLFLTGGSYAGYLTAWIVGNDQRFRAAVAQRGVYDLATFFGEGNAWRLVEYSFGGMPWEAEIREILVRESPVTYVESMHTPLLIMHASDDLRTGVSGSEMLYRALRELKRPVEYVRYPGEGHDLSRTGNPRNRVDRLLRIVEFFERFDE
ncbi:MAG: dipeptidyl aminopeptidase/acylaminoacyl peptidase [Planctomycetota bacterium]|jgi:dipeptidyl aminopeptidase/acylaminoacyl peptidase